MNNILSGYNSTALAYGVTGTGKTHTMFGDIYLNLNFEKGICMFAVDYLFSKIITESQNNQNNQYSLTTQSLDSSGRTYKVKISYLEIYNEQVVDLLVDRDRQITASGDQQHLMIVEDPNKGTSVPELTEYAVTNSEQVQNLIILGNSRRTMAATGVNQFSSRSHAILQINVEQILKSKDNIREEIVTSKLLLVDLAGSERGGLEKGIRREEGANINKSLLALGNCINILSDKSKKGSFVPYRDSKLTRLLKDSLGGNISTIMIACISPSILSYDETINTLKYASRARKIQKKITRNIKEIDLNNPYQNNIIDNLKNEIQGLKDIIKNQNILLRNRPIDSFREDRDFINLNLNLNLNINSNNNSNPQAQNSHNQILAFGGNVLGNGNNLGNSNGNGNNGNVLGNGYNLNNNVQNFLLTNSHNEDDFFNTNMNNNVGENLNGLLLNNFNNNYTLKKPSQNETGMANIFNQVGNAPNSKELANLFSLPCGYNGVNTGHTMNTFNTANTVNAVKKEINLGLTSTNNNNFNSSPPVKAVNLENYEDFLNKNLNGFTDDDFENFEKKLEE